MGNPQHFSLELPQRCLQLLEELWPHAKNCLNAKNPELGSLTTTFLISMSIPIIVFPIERIERHRYAQAKNYADDRHKNPEVAQSIIETLAGNKFEDAPFFAKDCWSFVRSPIFNISDRLPDDTANSLAADDAFLAAKKMPTSQWCSILRNAMAHGGIGYLDNSGRTSEDQPVTMLVFASGKYTGKGKYRTLTEINLLRISTENYRIFLRSWVTWLKKENFIFNKPFDLPQAGWLGGDFAALDTEIIEP
ncbi:hypothetical protein [Rhodomicrobium lacus]|uniref:hypothetical protein n=1 Tax=Rhodomicrobium lacus TaxID=2498452 RepID=UPI000F8DE08D|nr:hypothetical protein [Rhodomicrobium lacus]